MVNFLKKFLLSGAHYRASRAFLQKISSFFRYLEINDPLFFSTYHQQHSTKNFKRCFSRQACLRHRCVSKPTKSDVGKKPTDVGKKLIDVGRQLVCKPWCLTYESCQQCTTMCIRQCHRRLFFENCWNWKCKTSCSIIDH